MKITRRFLLTYGAAISLFSKIGMAHEENSSNIDHKHTKKMNPKPLILCTDLYHPHNDPDDHWDLATAYALSKIGKIDLQAVVIDYPPLNGDPAIISVAQMNFITGQSVPVAVGSQSKLRSSTEMPELDNSGHLDGANLIIKILEESIEPVTIVITGSSRDVALAGLRAPELFHKKCHAIYLNAGMGTTDPEKGANQDYNTLLDVEGFKTIFQLPCTVYWLPCLETFVNQTFQYETFGTLWTFKQNEILSVVSPQVQNYFLYMFRVEKNPLWLRYLEESPDDKYLEEVGTWTRGMWCTASFFHIAGLKVTSEGALVPIDAEDDGIYTFEPITVELNEDGIKNWHKDADSKDCFIYENHDLENLCSAMTTALKSILHVL